MSDYPLDGKCQECKKPDLVLIHMTYEDEDPEWIDIGYLCIECANNEYLNDDEDPEYQIIKCVQCDQGVYFLTEDKDPRQSQPCGKCKGDGYETVRTDGEPMIQVKEKCPKCEKMDYLFKTGYGRTCTNCVDVFIQENRQKKATT